MVGHMPKKVRGYKVEWLGETHYCGKLSEVREWLQTIRTVYEVDTASTSASSRRTVTRSIRCALTTCLTTAALD
jgi:hypothetical protein